MEILNISLRSSTKFGSFPIGLNPAPEPEIGLPIVDHFSMPQWAKIQKKVQFTVYKSRIKYDETSFFFFEIPTFFLLRDRAFPIEHFWILAYW